MDRNGKCPEVYEVQSGSALFSKRGKAGNTGSYKVSEKVYKKRPHVARICELHKVYFLLLSGCQRMRHFAPKRMCGVALRHIMMIYFAEAAERRVTSWAPPSTMETEETRVSLASLCRSGMVMAPQLHMVDLTLYRLASTLSWRVPA